MSGEEHLKIHYSVAVTHAIATMAGFVASSDVTLIEEYCLLTLAFSAGVFVPTMRIIAILCGEDLSKSYSGDKLWLLLCAKGSVALFALAWLSRPWSNRRLLKFILFTVMVLPWTSAEPHYDALLLSLSQLLHVLLSLHQQCQAARKMMGIQDEFFSALPVPVNLIIGPFVVVTIFLAKKAIYKLVDDHRKKKAGMEVSFWIAWAGLSFLTCTALPTIVFYPWTDLLDLLAAEFPDNSVVGAILFLVKSMPILSMVVAGGASFVTFHCIEFVKLNIFANGSLVDSIPKKRSMCASDVDTLSLWVKLYNDEIISVEELKRFVPAVGDPICLLLDAKGNWQWKTLANVEYTGAKHLGIWQRYLLSHATRHTGVMRFGVGVFHQQEPCIVRYRLEHLIHLVCKSASARSLEIVRCVVESYPAAFLDVPDSIWGRLPLHFACANPQASLEVIQYLVEQSPAAMLVPDHHGRLPIVLANSDGHHSMRVLVTLLRTASGGVLLALRNLHARRSWDDVLAQTIQKLEPACRLASEASRLANELGTHTWVDLLQDTLLVTRQEPGIHLAAGVFSDFLQTSIVERRNNLQAELDTVAAELDALADN